MNRLNTTRACLNVASCKGRSHRCYRFADAGGLCRALSTKGRHSRNNRRKHRLYWLACAKRRRRLAGVAPRRGKDESEPAATRLATGPCGRIGGTNRHEPARAPRATDVTANEKRQI